MPFARWSQGQGSSYFLRLCLAALVEVLRVLCKAPEAVVGLEVEAEGFERNEVTGVASSSSGHGALAPLETKSAHG